MRNDHSRSSPSFAIGGVRPATVIGRLVVDVEERPVPVPGVYSERQVAQPDFDRLGLSDPEGGN